MKYFIPILFFMMVRGLFAAAEISSDQCIEKWLKGIELFKVRRIEEALDSFNETVDALYQNNEPIFLNAVIERATFLLQMCEFSSSIDDFSYVLNHSKATKEQSLQALEGRCKAYLAAGNVRKFQEDAEQLDRLEQFMPVLLETESFRILKLNSYTLKNHPEKDSLAKCFLLRKEIESAEDFHLTSSGLAIIKKKHKSI